MNEYGTTSLLLVLYGATFFTKLTSIVRLYDLSPTKRMYVFQCCKDCTFIFVIRHAYRPRLTNTPMWIYEMTPYLLVSYEATSNSNLYLIRKNAFYSFHMDQDHTVKTRLQFWFSKLESDFNFMNQILMKWLFFARNQFRSIRVYDSMQKYNTLIPHYIAVVNILQSFPLFTIKQLSHSQLSIISNYSLPFHPHPKLNSASLLSSFSFPSISANHETRFYGRSRVENHV